MMFPQHCKPWRGLIFQNNKSFTSTFQKVTKIITNHNHNFYPHTLKESALIISEYFSRAEGKYDHGHYRIEHFLTLSWSANNKKRIRQTNIESLMQNMDSKALWGPCFLYFAFASLMHLLMFTTESIWLRSILDPFPNKHACFICQVGDLNAPPLSKITARDFRTKWRRKCDEKSSLTRKCDLSLTLGQFLIWGWVASRRDIKAIFFKLKKT